MPVHKYIPRYEDLLFPGGHTSPTESTYFQTRLASVLFMDYRTKKLSYFTVASLVCINKPQEWTTSPVQVAEVTRLTVPAAQHFRICCPWECDHWDMWEQTTHN